MEVLMKTIRPLLTAGMLTLVCAAPAVADPTIYFGPKLTVNRNNTCSLDTGVTIATPTAPNKIQYVFGTSVLTAKDWLDFNNKLNNQVQNFYVQSINITYDGKNVTYVFITIRD
jgi:hypothetical protein